MAFQSNPFQRQVLPPVVKNLLIINVIVFLTTLLLEKQGIDLNDMFGLHYFQAPKFRPYQLVSYMFMHGGWTHILFNMFALWMFGSVMENEWGPKRFLTYYFVCGIGAGLVENAAFYYSLKPLLNDLNAAQSTLKYSMEYIIEARNNILNAPSAIGASGAVFGILLAYGMTFPNNLIFIYGVLPLKAKYLVILYGAFELYSGISATPGDNVAHFAHLGGLLFGFILIMYWRSQSNNRFNQY
jgi:membrane associated rhomboid family serine protease